MRRRRKIGWGSVKVLWVLLSCRVGAAVRVACCLAAGCWLLAAGWLVARSGLDCLVPGWLAKI